MTIPVGILQFRQFDTYTWKSNIKLICDCRMISRTFLAQVLEHFWVQNEYCLDVRKTFDNERDAIEKKNVEVFRIQCNMGQENET